MKSNGSLLLIVLLGLSLIACNVPKKKGYESAIRAGDEEMLRTNLKEIRFCLKQYEMDQGVPAQALTDLIEAGCLNQVPIDPMTNKADWIVETNECPTMAQCKKGIKNIHSASRRNPSKVSLMRVGKVTTTKEWMLLATFWHSNLLACRNGPDMVSLGENQDSGKEWK